MKYSYIVFVKRVSDNKVLTRYTTGTDILSALEQFEEDFKDENHGWFTVEAIRRGDVFVPSSPRP